MEPEFGPVRSSHSSPLCTSPPVPKPRTKLNVSIGEATPCPPRPPPSLAPRAPPPRPPPPKARCTSPSRAAPPPPVPRPTLLLETPALPPSFDNAPPVVPPRPNVRPLPSPDLVEASTHPSQTARPDIFSPSRSPFSSSAPPQDAPPPPPYPVTDPTPRASSEPSSCIRLPSPPPIGWLSARQPSLEESLEPLPDLPSGIVRTDSSEEWASIDQAPSEMNLVTDRPPLDRDSPDELTNCLPEDRNTPPSSPPPVVTSSVAVTLSDLEPAVDFVENPIYLRLDSFRARCFPRPSIPAATALQQVESASAFSFIDPTVNSVVNVPYVHPHASTLLLTPKSTAENSPAKASANPISVELPLEMSWGRASPFNIERPKEFRLPEKPLPSPPSPPSSSGEVTPTPIPPPRSPRERVAPKTACCSSPPTAPPPPLPFSGTRTLYPILSPASPGEEDPPTPIADPCPDGGCDTSGPSQYANILNDVPYPNVAFRPSSYPHGRLEMYNGEHINTDSFLPHSSTVTEFDESTLASVEPVSPVFVEEVDAVVDGNAVSYSGSAELFTGKKEKRTVYVRLNHGGITVYEDEESMEPIAGPYDLRKAEFVGRQAETDTIVCRFAVSEGLVRKDSKRSRERDREAQRELRFTPKEQEHLDHWLILLGQCWLSPWDALRKCASSGLTICGRIWLRQGATAGWTCAIAFLHKMTVSYLVQEHADHIDELDLRKVVSIKSNMDQSEWCPLAKKKEKGKEKGSGGPFLISFEGGSLCIECDDASSVVFWRRALEVALSNVSCSLDECRLTADDVPVHIDKCLRFVYTYGLCQEGIYRKNGRITEANEIEKQLRQDPVDYHIVRETDETVLAVADVLRRFLRELDKPLFPSNFHEHLFNVYRMKTEFPEEKCAEYRQIFQCETFPAVNYSTIRRLIDHLREITRHSDDNKATIYNVAKVFGPSVFCVEKEQTDPSMYKDTNVQIGVLVDLITGFADIFQMTAREMMTREKLNVTDYVSRQHKKPAGVLLVPIHVWEKDNRAFNVSSDLVADEVCCEALRLRGFDAPTDSTYAIFEVIRGGSLSRRLTPNEKLSSIVIGRWMEWKCTDGYMLFNHDTHPFDEQNANTFSGKVKLAEPGSKQFKSVDLRVEEGTKLCLYRNLKLTHQWSIDDVLWFTGAEPARKAPYPFNATFFVLSSSCSEKMAGYCVSFKTQPERTQFLNAVHFAKTRGDATLLVRL